MIRGGTVFAGLVAAVTVACTARDPSRADSSASRERVEIGAPAPAYSATSLNGDSVSLADRRDRVVLLNVWATWCHPCREEIPVMRVLDSTYRHRGLEVIGVSVDADGTDQSIRDFVAEFRMTYTIWRDPEERVLSRFLAVGVPATYLIDRGGVLRWRITGPIRPGDTTLMRAIERAVSP